MTSPLTDPGSPFSHHPVPPTDRPAPGAAAAGEPQARVRVEKPWGHEEIFAILEGRYVGKVLHIRAGAALSLQRHLLKEETLAVQSGRITVEHGPDQRNLQTLTLEPGSRSCCPLGSCTGCARSPTARSSRSRQRGPAGARTSSVSTTVTGGRGRRLPDAASAPECGASSVRATGGRRALCKRHLAPCAARPVADRCARHMTVRRLMSKLDPEHPSAAEPAPTVADVPAATIASWESSPGRS